MRRKGADLPDSKAAAYDAYVRRKVPDDQVTLEDVKEMKRARHDTKMKEKTGGWWKSKEEYGAMDSAAQAAHAAQAPPKKDVTSSAASSYAHRRFQNAKKREIEGIYAQGKAGTMDPEEMDSKLEPAFVERGVRAHEHEMNRKRRRDPRRLTSRQDPRYKDEDKPVSANTQQIADDTARMMKIHGRDITEAQAHDARAKRHGEPESGVVPDVRRKADAIRNANARRIEQLREGKGAAALADEVSPSEFEYAKGLGEQANQYYPKLGRPGRGGPKPRVSFVGVSAQGAAAGPGMVGHQSADGDHGWVGQDDDGRRDS